MSFVSQTHLPALILHANGTNRDHEAAQALEVAGAEPEIVHLNQLRWGERQWDDYRLLVLPGGFSYGDALGAGRLLALDLKIYFAEAVRRFIESGRPVIGICNGFQALVKAGLLPDPPTASGGGLQSGGPPASGQPTAALPVATLTSNASGRFECRWVTLAPRSQRCLWTRGLDQPFICPVAHGEGRFVLASETDLIRLQENDQIALIYTHLDGKPAQGIYPQNPNGSVADIAGVSNYQGNVLGLMPHPEDHIFPFQHPRWTRARHANLDIQHNSLGLSLFINGVRYAGQI